MTVQEVGIGPMKNALAFRDRLINAYRHSPAAINEGDIRRIYDESPPLAAPSVVEPPVDMTGGWDDNGAPVVWQPAAAPAPAAEGLHVEYHDVYEAPGPQPAAPQPSALDVERLRDALLTADRAIGVIAETDAEIDHYTAMAIEVVAAYAAAGGEAAASAEEGLHVEFHDVYEEALDPLDDPNHEDFDPNPKEWKPAGLECPECGDLIANPGALVNHRKFRHGLAPPQPSLDVERLTRRLTEVIEDAESQHPGGWGPDVTTVVILREIRDDLAAAAPPPPRVRP